MLLMKSIYALQVDKLAFNILLTIFFKTYVGNFPHFILKFCNLCAS